MARREIQPKAEKADEYINEEIEKIRERITYWQEMKNDADLMITTLVKEITKMNKMR